MYLPLIIDNDTVSMEAMMFVMIYSLFPNAGILLCLLWILFIKNYKQLNSAKFEVINRLELQLPARPFNNEWETLQKSKKYPYSVQITVLVVFHYFQIGEE